MRLRTPRVRLQLGIVGVSCMLCCAAPPLHANANTPRLGLSPALLELPDGTTLSVPAPHILVGGISYVPTQRKRIFKVMNSLQPSSASKVAAQAAGFLEVLVNDPIFDSPGLGETQNEPTLTAVGDTIVCGFNDSRGFFFTNDTVSGYAYSLNGGETWTDGGSLPITSVAGASEILLGEPALVSDGLGRWFYVSVYDVGNGSGGRGSGDFGLAISEGRFDNGVMVWGVPQLFSGGLTAGSSLALTHVAYDAAVDQLYVTFTDFSYPLQGWGQVVVVTLANHASQVLYETVLQPETPGTNNGGSRVAVGPNGEVFVVWASGVLGGGTGQGPAWQKIVRSLDGGATFSAAVVAGEVVESWLSNPPGAAREDVSPEFPALAVDTQPGPNLGRVYVAWQDAVQMVFSDPLTEINETSAPNDTPQAAQVIPDSLPSVQIHGSLPGTDTNDYYRFTGNVGEHLRIITKVESGLLSMRLRVWCANPTGGGVDTLLAQSARGIQQAVFALITLPYTGEYVVQLERVSFDGDYDSFIRRTTLTQPSVAIDHRDIVVVSSSDGISNWSTKVRVNDDTQPADQSWPDVVADAAGVHVAWYDRRFDPRCKALADMVMSSSLDGGATWTPNIRLTSDSSWWQIPSDAIPAFGDHSRMTANEGTLHIPWTDGRLGTPDVLASSFASAVGLVLPDSILAVEGQMLQLPIGVQAGVAPEDTFQVSLTATCGSALPDFTWVLTNLTALSETTLVYNPYVSSEIVNVVPCTMLVDAWSRRTDVHVQKLMPVNADGLISVALQDFTADWRAGEVTLRWRAEATNRFEVQRSMAELGPWVTTESGLAVANSSTGWFEYRDRELPAGSTAWYRLLGTDFDGSQAMFGPYRVEAQGPRQVRLFPAQPNPFNPQTRLQFELPQRSQVTLRILDARGRRVVTLTDQIYEAGRYGLQWDGRTSSQASVASGIYFAELRVEGRRHYTRLALIR